MICDSSGNLWLWLPHIGDVLRGHRRSLTWQRLSSCKSQVPCAIRDHDIAREGCALESCTAVCADCLLQYFENPKLGKLNCTCSNCESSILNTAPAWAERQSAWCPRLLDRVCHARTEVEEDFGRLYTATYSTATLSARRKGSNYERRTEQAPHSRDKILQIAIAGCVCSNVLSASVHRHLPDPPPM